MTRLAEAQDLAALRSTLRRLCQGFGHDYDVRTSEAGGNARELWTALGAAAALGVAIPEEHGGGGQGMEALPVVAEEVAAAGTPLMLIALSPAVCATMVAETAARSSRSSGCPVSRTAPGCWHSRSQSRARVRTPTRSPRGPCRSETDGSSGQKTYVSHVDNCDALVVAARAEGGSDGVPAGLRAFLVPRDAPGLTATEIRVEIPSPEGQYALFLDDVAVSASASLGARAGLGVLFSGLNPERILSAALLNGISRYALAKAASYARERVVRGEPIGGHQAVAHPLARAATGLAAAQLLTEVAARAHDQGDRTGVRAAMAKLAASEAASAALDAAIQTHGGNGMAREYGLATLHADGGYRRLPAEPEARWAVGQVVMAVIVPERGASGTELAAASVQKCTRAGHAAARPSLVVTSSVLVAR